MFCPCYVIFGFGILSHNRKKYPMRDFSPPTISDPSQFAPQIADPQHQGFLSRYTRGDSNKVLAALQTAQDELGYLAPETVKAISDHLSVSASEVYGVASFYAQFRFQKPGKHTVKVCQGTACHVRRSDLVLDAFEHELGIHNGETTADGQYSLERVACFGCCALAPVVVVDEDTHARMRTTFVRKLLKQYAD
jgi:NADH-quinone oxidoreductase subunit E